MDRPRQRVLLRSDPASGRIVDAARAAEARADIQAQARRATGSTVKAVMGMTAAMP